MADLPEVFTVGEPGHVEAHEATNIAVNALARDLAAGLATTAPARLPSYASPRTRRFDPATGVYNRTGPNTRIVRAALGQAAAGAGLCRVAMIGDSVTAGPVPGSTDPAVGLRGHLRALGYSTGELVLMKTSSTPDVRWTLTNWTDITGGDQAFPWLSGTDSTTVARYRSEAAGTVVEIVTRSDTAAFSYSIDGAAPVTITPAGGTAVQVITVTGLADRPHQVDITAAATGTTYLAGAGVRRASGVVLMNMGQYGALSSSWANSTWNRIGPLAGALNPDLVICELGINDQLNAVGAATFTTNLTAALGLARGTSADALIVMSHQIQNGTGWTNLLAAGYDVADALDVPLLDLTDRLGDYATWTGLGLGLDANHLNASGVAVKVRAAAEALGMEQLTDRPAQVTSAATGIEIWADGRVATAPRTLTGGEEAGTSGRLHLAYFTPERDRTISSLGLATASTAGSGITLSRAALFEVAADGSIRKLAQTAASTTQGNGSFQTMTAAMSTSGGWPASYTLRAGVRYALGWLCVATTPPSFWSHGLIDSARPPVVSRFVNSQTDIADTYADGALTTYYQVPYLVGY